MVTQDARIILVGRTLTVSSLQVSLCVLRVLGGVLRVLGVLVVSEVSGSTLHRAQVTQLAE
jgi:hypothetical protein